jgi:TPR repeat protein
MYYYGQGVLPAYDEAVRWVRLSEKHRDSLAYESIERWAMIKKGE